MVRIGSSGEYFLFARHKRGFDPARSSVNTSDFAAVVWRIRGNHFRMTQFEHC
jgi:hypothetical protein